MKTSQLPVVGALLAGYVQACTRIRVDNSIDQNNPKLKVTTITAFDDDRPPIGALEFRSRVDRPADTWLFRESSGQVDVYMTWPEGPFGKTIAGEVAFPWGKNYIVGDKKGNIMTLEQKAEYTYWNETGVEHLKFMSVMLCSRHSLTSSPSLLDIHCLWDNYNCGNYYCGI